MFLPTNRVNRGHWRGEFAPRSTAKRPKSSATLRRRLPPWGYSSAGRAPAWHAGGRRAPRRPTSSPITVGAHEYRAKLGWYMERAAAGESFLITRRGKPCPPRAAHRRAHLFRAHVAPADIPHVDGVRHRFVGANGIIFHVAEADDGDDPVLLLHGWPQHWYEWRHLLIGLADTTASSPSTCAALAGPTLRRSATRRRSSPTDVLAVARRARDRPSEARSDTTGAAGSASCSAFARPERFDRFLALGVLHPWQTLGRSARPPRFTYQLLVPARRRRARLCAASPRPLGPPRPARGTARPAASTTARRSLVRRRPGAAGPARACAPDVPLPSHPRDLPADPRPLPWVPV